MKKRGFTLIELLVVISIVGLLASVVLSNVNSARNKAKDVAIKENMLEFRKITELDYSETGDYDNLQVGGEWSASEADCNAKPFAGNYAATAKQICSSIVASAPSNTILKLYIGHTNGGNQFYSLMAPLNKGGYFCVGVSGINEVPSYNSIPYPAGCYYNP